MAKGYSMAPIGFESMCVEMLKGIKDDIQSVREAVFSTNREIGGIQSTLSAFKEHNDWQDHQLEIQRKKLSDLALVPPASCSLSGLPKSVFGLVVAFAIGVGLMAIIIWQVLGGKVPSIGG